MNKSKSANAQFSYADCFALLDEYGTPNHIKRHCVGVSNVAFRIANTLQKSGIDIDPDLVRRAAVLHDIARLEPDHASAGADIVEKYDPAAAAIIRDHMSHFFPDSLEEITELDLVSLADRMVREDQYIGFKNRMGEILQRFSDDSAALAIFTEKIGQTERLIAAIEKRIGYNIDDIVSGGSVPVSGILPLVEKPGRYIGGEINVCQKDPNSVSTRYGFAFPDLYEIGMSYTGLQIIYGLLNSLEDVYCERIFAPARDMESLMRERNIPLFTLETFTDVKRLHFLAFTLQYEMSFSNVVNMLELANIPVLSKDRDASYPIIFGGGPCSYNPEPLADIFDMFGIGDGEELLPKICELNKKFRTESKITGSFDKNGFLAEAAKIDGIYVPSFYEPIYENANHGSFVGFRKKVPDAPDRIRKSILHDLDSAYFPSKPIVPLIETVHNRAVTEIFRGCGRGCLFCQAGFVYRPIRRRKKETIKQTIRDQLASTGYDEVSLLSLSTGDYPDIEALTTELMDELREKDISLSLPSLRLDSVSGDTLEKIGEYKRSSLTFAPEAGTQRLRDVINKNITEENIFSGIEKAISIGWNRVKFYFMIGLPTETYEDLDGIADLAKRVMYRARSMQGKGNRNFSLTVSVSNFVPKPHTPLQWCKGNTEEELIAKNKYLKELFASIKGATFQYHDTKTSYVEMLIAKGDRRMGRAIIEAVSLGCRFDSWSEFFNYENWLKAFESAGISFEDNYYTDPDSPLPWDIIDDGTEKEFLAKLYQKATEGGLTPEI